MSGAEWLAGLSGLAALGTLIFAVWTRLSSSMTNVQQVFTAQQEHMGTLAQENKDLRERQTNHGVQMARMQDTHQQEMDRMRTRLDKYAEDRRQCERDKVEMRAQIKRLEELVNDLRS